MVGLLKQYDAQPIFGLLGPKQPEAYELRVKGVKKLVYVLGPYITAIGGCDRIQPYDLILDLLEKYSVKGHVVFEGVIVSSSYGRVGALMERFGQQAVMAFLTTSLEDCLKNVQKRRNARADARQFNPQNTISKFEGIAKSRVKIEAANKLRVVDLDPKLGPGAIVALLKEAV